MNTLVPQIVDENGKMMPVDHEMITRDIFKALKATNNPDMFQALNLADKVIQRLIICKGADAVITMEQLMQMGEFVLMEANNFDAAREYKLLFESVEA